MPTIINDWIKANIQTSIAIWTILNWWNHTNIIRVCISSSKNTCISEVVPIYHIRCIAYLLFGCRKSSMILH